MAKSQANFTITNKTRGKLPSLPLSDMKDAVLGKKYQLSLVIVGNAASRKLNKSYRNKDKPANVLSFIIAPGEGELFLNPKKAANEAAQFGRSTRSMIGFLFIHGMLHLKGMDHGSRMESKERLFCKRFGM
jgi:probable rRNA maturation factor